VEITIGGSNVDTSEHQTLQGIQGKETKVEEEGTKRHQRSQRANGNEYPCVDS